HRDQRDRARGDGGGRRALDRICRRLFRHAGPARRQDAGGTGPAPEGRAVAKGEIRAETARLRPGEKAVLQAEIRARNPAGRDGQGARPDRRAGDEDGGPRLLHPRPGRFRQGRGRPRRPARKARRHGGRVAGAGNAARGDRGLTISVFLRIMNAQKKDFMMRNEAPSVRKAANLSIDADLLAEAKALSVNISRAAEAGIADAVRKEKERAWKEENREAIEGWNAWVEEHGLPLAKYRQF